ncbi:hypothetical protein CHS0354_000762 [Potamilus streckersoni]|uniref:Rhodanese domain-containing protein n=1 Tax=Potamilus streckersoni TaxID=2493646 RepID=A0AAE0T884_9BIVA|nr:hypothetical protein CHS0354_000762 [Potamilus streckersoni]
MKNQDELTHVELARYNRQIILPQLGIFGQSKLKRGRVLVVGAGGLGSPVLLYLAAAGVGCLGIVDDDFVSLSNLQRQVLYKTSDIGQAKVNVAKHAIQALNPNTCVCCYNTKLRANNVESMISLYDIIVDGSDNFATRYLLNDACVLLNKPLVYGGVFQFEGQVSVFNQLESAGCRSANYRDLFPSPPPIGSRPACGEAGVLGSLPGIVGSLQATEAIKLLLEMHEYTLKNKLLTINMFTLEFRTISFSKDPTAEPILRLIDYDEFCSTPKTSISNGIDGDMDMDIDYELSQEDFIKLCESEDIFILDVREEWEYEAHNIGGMHIPQGDVAKKLHCLPKDKPIIVVCQSGSRSLDVAKMLIKQYTFLQVQSLKEIPIDAVPDVTNNQVQIITTSKNLSTQDVEKFLTYPIELELGNLPGVQEIRSVSKFGLSVITVVFPDEIGTYLPRQLISEKLKFAEEKIPEGFGKPFMGPITTGLGEIYQYVLEVEPEYKHRYSQSDLRTIQDWVIKRQLSGISGVVEINTWGGFLKQYEVAVNPERLRAIDVSLSDVFTALEKNNSIAGGSYIEKTNESYFIRGEGLITTIEDIKKVVITTRKGIPILIKDVAKVGFGYANRYGAITMDGKGETVLGQVMMLKGGNTNKIIKSVKERVVEIQKILPKGIKINPFLERSDLIAKTTFTIYENLIIGSVIVMFVVILLLGNLISALIVTSVIPLSLLFTLSCMYIFNVNANLLSLGAVDFGIIIDGAIIIIEYVAMTITKSRLELLGLPKVRQQHLRNTLTFSGTSKMMRSAIFGQVIIIIVFIPILSLVGVEGKMFRPMALVFCFALVGAMVLCFTYLPVIASIFLKPNLHDKKNFSDKVITRLELYYSKTLILALRNKKSVFISSLLAILISLILFFRVGGEFVPTLDEGSFVIQPVIKTGTSLTRTIELVTQMERILKGFPEVHHVVSRIGAAEIPTDPMSMEQSDVIITLKPKSEWTSAKTKDELANKFKEALSVIPDVDYEFTQPIEMRFNELITGVRADLAIKVFGENLDILQKKADEISAAIQNVEGASDIVVEKIAGLPQMLVEFDRNKIAKYGLNIADLNQIIKTSFSGTEAGLILEKDRQFDLVVRLDTDHRKTIEDIQTTTIKLPNGNTLPLREFANINYHTGPAQISRDNTHRRIVVTVNVRNRDLESVVNDVQTIVKNKISMPAGYFITYGGQFENLRQAKQRLSIALPTALLLIFVLLYFAFRSLKESLIIYSAIPLASVGGVFLLFLRDLPFSISAGIGFIALFGIAVLNGIVLIEEYNALKKHGMNNVLRRILTGSKLRLRPVLLTATAAAFGFLPMAFSGSVGAEVQRPLATVVIEKMELGHMTKQTFSHTTQVTGIIDVPPENRASVSTYFAGYVKDLSVLPGQRVKKGQVLFTLESPEYIRIQANYLKSKESLAYLKQDYERQAGLLKDSITSKKNFLKAETEYKVNLADYESGRIQLSMMNISPDLISPENLVSVISILSPIQGYVTEVNITKGKYLSPSDIAVSIVNSDHIHVELEIFEADVPKVEIGQKILFRLQNGAMESYPAHVYLIDKIINVEKRTGSIHGHLDNEKHSELFSVGMYVEAEIFTSTYISLALPESSITTIDGTNYVLVKKESKEESIVFEKREVKIGKNMNGFSEVLNSSEFNDREEFLIKGGSYILNNQAVN